MHCLCFEQVRLGILVFFLHQDSSDVESVFLQANSGSLSKRVPVDLIMQETQLRNFEFFLIFGFRIAETKTLAHCGTQDMLWQCGYRYG